MITVMINSFGVVLMLYSGAGISAISSVPFAFSEVAPVISLGTWTYIFQAAHTGGPLRNILIRSTVWTDTIKAEEKRMIEDEHDNVQIKYGSAGRAALDAIGSRY